MVKQIPTFCQDQSRLKVRQWILLRKLCLINDASGIPFFNLSSASAKASTATSVVGAVSQKLVRLAKKLRMNSDVRRSIFYVIMSSEVRN